MKKIAIYSSHLFEESYLTEANKDRFELLYNSEPLSATTLSFCEGCAGIAVFTSDDVSASILEQLKEKGICFVVTRSTGYDHIDLQKAADLDIAVANVPGYSPHAIAEHAVALMLALNRHLVRSDEKVQQFDFSINDLIGFNLHNKTVGIIGTGKIGAVVCKILYGFGCKLLAFDIKKDPLLVEKYGLEYVSLEKLCSESAIITLHAPLNKSTEYIINKSSISLMQEGVMLINTSRGKLMNTADVLDALNSGRIGFLGTDVYEKEKGIFFNDLSSTGITDTVLRSLVSHKNVLLTSHHAFLTKEALKTIADITISNIDCFIKNEANANALLPH